MTTPLDAWHEIVRTRKTDGLDALLAENVVFESPVVHTPQLGRATTAKYLRAALDVLNNGSFRYLDRWEGASSAVLEFLATIEGIEINGVDLIRWNEAGRIVHFKVMVRPLKALNLIHRKMGEALSV